jgi:hypothetical protein
LAKNILLNSAEAYSQQDLLATAYRNFDIPSHRKEILSDQIPAEPALVVLDEIHKYARWRSLETQKQRASKFPL